MIDLISIAQEGKFQSGRLVNKHSMTDTANLPWNGSKDDNRGFIRHVPNGRCEDGEIYDVLQMHPKWVDNGTIKAWLPWQKLPESAVLKVKVGFLQGAKDTNGVAFQVWEHHNNEKGQEVWNQILHHEKKHTGKLTTLQAELSHLSGQDVGIELRVDAAGHSTFDWAVWVEPVIESRVPDVNLMDFISKGQFESGKYGDDRYRQFEVSSLSLNGSVLDGNGSVIHLQSALCEDGKRHNVLQMNPKRISNSIIVAKFPNILLPYNSIFKAKIGFLSSPQSTDRVQFLLVCYRDAIRHYRILHYGKKYSGELLEVQAEIPAYVVNDRYTDIELVVVKPQGSSSNSRAVWIDPVIEGRPTGESLTEESRDRISYIQWAASSETHKHYITPMEDGLHVRWWWHERLPFPKGGFTIKMNDGSTIHIPVPKSPHEVLKRLGTHPKFHSSIQQRYTQASHKVFELLEVLDKVEGTENREERHLRLMGELAPGALSWVMSKFYIQSILLRASLSPYLARLIGIYKILPNMDTGHITHRSSLSPFQIIGHWGDEYWPLHTHYLHYADLNRNVIRYLPKNKKLALRHCELIALNREISIENNNVLLKTINGKSGAAFRLQFEFPVERVRIEFEEKGKWKTSCDNQINQFHSHKFVISKPAHPFQTLDVLEGPDGTWRIHKIEFREIIGPIGDQSSINQPPINGNKIPNYTKWRDPIIELFYEDEEGYHEHMETFFNMVEDDSIPLKITTDKYLSSNFYPAQGSRPQIHLE